MRECSCPFLVSVCMYGQIVSIGLPTLDNPPERDRAGESQALFLATHSSLEHLHTLCNEIAEVVLHDSMTPYP